MSNSKNGGDDSVNISLDRATAEKLVGALTRQLSATSGTQASDLTWRTTNAPVASSRTDDIWFEDQHTGWLVNSNGQVCTTSDGGQSWVQQLFVPPGGPGKPYLRTIHFADGEVGWFGALCGEVDGYRDALLHSTRDGGETWHPVRNLPQGVPQGICGLAVVDANTMYGAGSNDPSLIGPGVIKTVDGGDTWQLIDMSAYADNLIDVYFLDAERGYVVGGKNHPFCEGEKQPWYDRHPQYRELRPVVLYTQDGGANWENVISGLSGWDCGAWGWKMFWLDDRHAFVSIEDFKRGVILATTDGGSNWTRYNINDRRVASGKGKGKGKRGKGKGKGKGEIVANANLEGIGFIDPKTGWVGGWGDPDFIGNYNSFTDDGGRYWTAQDHVPDDPESDVRINVNRYRFITRDGVKVGYCSGKSVYKLVIDDGGKGGGKPKAARRVAAPAAAAPALDLACRPGDRDGEVRIQFSVPSGTRTVYVGIWNHFGWHVRTLLDQPASGDADHTIVWDGVDADGDARRGAFICRVACDDTCESEIFHL